MVKFNLLVAGIMRKDAHRPCTARAVLKGNTTSRRWVNVIGVFGITKVYDSDTPEANEENRVLGA
jgi:hypothetical protein